MIVTITQNGNHLLKDSQGNVIAESPYHNVVVEAAYQQPAGTYTLETANEVVLVEADPPTPPPHQGYPSWRSGMIAGTWKEIQLGAKLSDVDPAKSAAINPNYPNSAPWKGVVGQTAIVSAWCGACWDDATATMWLPLSGGHEDYAGNEAYKCCLNVDTPTFTMIRNPTGAIGNVGVLNDGMESTGNYFDGRPRATHSYNKHVYVPGHGPVLPVQGACYRNGYSGTEKTLLLNEHTGEWTHKATLSGIGAAPTGGGAYDADRNRIWWVSKGNSYLNYLDINTWAWTTLGGNQNPTMGAQCVVYIPGKDVILCVHSTLASYGRIQVFTTTGRRYTPGTIGVPGAALHEHMGAAWCESLGCVLAWHNTTNRTMITTITPPPNPITEPWVVGTLPVSASNTVTPTAAQANGTYGRFAVSEKLNACLLLNSTGQNIYAFALS